MTLQEFKDASYSNKTVIRYQDQNWFVASVDFGEALIGLCSDPKDEDEEIRWVRYENCTIISN